MIEAEHSPRCGVCGTKLKGMMVLPFCPHHFHIHELRVCPICGRELPLTIRATYCHEHEQQYTLRRERGVTTSELDTRWGDTLAVWRDRPSVLAEEDAASEMRFYNRVGNWLIFSKGDKWLAVNTDTDDIRRVKTIRPYSYSDANDIELWRNLFGDEARPTTKLTAPPDDAVQELLSRRREYYKDEFDKAMMEVLASSDELHARYSTVLDPHSLTRIIYRVDSSVYGLEGKPLDLIYSGIAFHADNYGVEINSIRFQGFVTSLSKQEQIAQAVQHQRARRILHAQWDEANPGWLDKRVSITPDELDKIPPPTYLPPTMSFIVSYRERPSPEYRASQSGDQRRRNWPPFPPTFIAYYLEDRLPESVNHPLTGEQRHEFCFSAAEICFSYMPAWVEQLASSEVQLIQRPVSVAGKEFAATVLYWLQPSPICVYVLERKELPYITSTLSGEAYGINIDQLFELFDHLVPINARPDLFTQYDAENEGFYVHQQPI